MAEKKKKDARRLPEDENLNSRWTEGIPLSPSWWAPAFVTILLVGLAYLVVYYLSGGKYPIPGINFWNLLVGIGIILVGFAMTLRWR